MSCHTTAVVINETISSTKLISGLSLWESNECLNMRTVRRNEMLKALKLEVCFLHVCIGS